MSSSRAPHFLSSVKAVLVGCLIGLLGLAQPMFAAPGDAAGNKSSAVTKDPRIALAAQAATDFIAMPQLSDAHVQYETWLAGQSYASVIQAYGLLQRISLRQPELVDCVREKRAISTEITANPFALAPAVLALKCAELAGDAKLAAQLEARIQVRLSMLLADGRGQLPATPAKLMSWWDILAFADISGLQWRNTSYYGGLSIADLTAITVFDIEPSATSEQSSPQTPRQASYYFDIFGEKFRAGLSARDYETPWQRLSSIQNFMQDLAKADDIDARIYLQEYAITVAQEGVPEALAALREMLKQPESALPAALSLVQLATVSETVKLVESDLDPLFEAAEAKNSQALMALAMERTFGFVEPADLNEANALLQAAQQTYPSSNAVAQLVLLSGVNRRKAPPAFALRALKTQVEQKLPAAIVTAYILAAAYKERLKGGEWLSGLIDDQDRLMSLKGATRAGVFVSLTAIQPHAPNAFKMACEAAAFGVVRAKMLCASLSPGSEQRTRYLIESSGEFDVLAKADDVSRVALVSSELANYFEARDPAGKRAPDLGRAAEWALSGIAFGDAKSYSLLATLALRGAKLSNFHWDLIRRLFAEQSSNMPGRAQTELALAFGGSAERPKLLAKLLSQCVKKNAPACEVLAWARELAEPNSQQQEMVVDALQLCIRAIDHEVKTQCSHSLAMRYIYGNGVKKDVGRGLAYLEKLTDPSIIAINEIAWIRCTAPEPPLFAPANATKYWPKLISAKAPFIQDTLAACYAASGMFELASAMLEKVITNLPAETAVATEAEGDDNAPTLKQLLQKHSKNYLSRKRWVQQDLL